MTNDNAIASALVAILRDYEATIETIKEGKVPVISIGQFGRISTAKDILKANGVTLSGEKLQASASPRGYVTHNEKADISVNGSHLMGECEADTTYADLLALFGKPEDGDAYKVDAEWVLQFDDGKIATIYNYKTGKNYCGDEGKETADLCGDDWHIGGQDPIVVERVHLIIREFHNQKKAAA